MGEKAKRQAHLGYGRLEQKSPKKSPSSTLLSRGRLNKALLSCGVSTQVVYCMIPVGSKHNPAGRGGASRDPKQLLFVFTRERE